MVRSSKKLLMVVMAAILLFSQAGLFGLQSVNAASLDNAVTVSAIEEDGTQVLNPVAVEISDGDTAFDVLEKADGKLESDSYGDMGEFITGINGTQEEFGQNFWSFYVNGEFQSMGASSTEVSNGDNIQFVLTTIEGNPSEIAVTVSAMDANGEVVIEEKVVSMPEHTTAYDALLKAAADQGVRVGVTVDSEYLTFLNYLGEPLERGCEFWSTSMNGEMMIVGLLGHTIQEGDVLELVVDDWCAPEEPIVEEKDETEEPTSNEKNGDEETNTIEKNNDVDTDYEKALINVLDYLVANPSQLDWYGFSALHSADVSISSQLADDIAASIAKDYIENSGYATDVAKDIIILTSAGYNATDVNGINLINVLLEKDMNTSNRLVYSLIAINSGDYQLPQEDRTRLINEILELELPAGGWSFFGDNPSPDITGMALLALSPYKDQAEVKGAIDRAVAAMSTRQGEKGGYDEVFNGGYSAESAAMVIVGLSAVGIDATSDAFTKSEGNLLEHLLDYQREDGSFKHLIDDTSSSVFAINQGALALVAYDKFKNGTGTVFNFHNKDQSDETDDSKDENLDQDKDENKDKEKPDDTNDPIKELNKVNVTKENLNNYEQDHAVIVTPENGTQQSKFEVSVDSEVIDYLIQENKPLVIDNGNTIVTIPVDVLKQLREHGETIELVLVEQEADGALGAVYDFLLKVDGKIVSAFDSPITIELAVDEDKVKDIDPNLVKTFYYNEETEQWEVNLDSNYDSNTGFVTFTTTHFSTFGVFEYDGEVKPDPVNLEEDKDEQLTGTNKTSPTSTSTNAEGKALPNTATDMFNLLAFGLILTAAGIALYIMYRRKVME
ncbi:DUF4430 domain-containing protein [Oceanobacillus saliphilus]|uniref:DUF4430 domain-containing protein n=1 Tax=Oceanobacillus saliphilus TaxID=2925834 RepID=UPI00201DA8BC|nr:DUF4430 domain-containing protein [Oceanobacillus saliphilus]